MPACGYGKHIAGFDLHGEILSQPQPGSPFCRQADFGDEDIHRLNDPDSPREDLFLPVPEIEDQNIPLGGDTGGNHLEGNRKFRYLGHSFMRGEYFGFRQGNNCLRSAWRRPETPMFPLTGVWYPRLRGSDHPAGRRPCKVSLPYQNVWQ